VWGIGIPQIGKWSQRIIIAAIRAMMDNAGDSAGVNLVLGNGVDPDDGQWEITGKKIWRTDSDVDDVRKVFAQFQVANNQADLQAIFDLGMKLIDMETAMPMLFQGEKAEAPETLGATNIMVDANNVSLRSRVKRYDDCITKRHITRYYDHNMQYSDKQDIKGDFCVEVKGATVLLEKDQHAQILLQLLGSQAPQILTYVHPERATKKLFDALKLADVMKTDTELAEEKKAQAQQQQPGDPRIEAANIKVQGDMQKAQLVQQSDMAEIQAKADAGLQDRQLRAADAERDREHQRAMKEIDYNIKMMELSQSQNIALADIKSTLARDGAKLKAQVYMAGPDKKGPQIATPIVEPEGRAGEGKAYQD